MDEKDYSDYSNCCSEDYSDDDNSNSYYTESTNNDSYSDSTYVDTCSLLSDIYEQSSSDNTFNEDSTDDTEESHDSSEDQSLDSLADEYDKEYTSTDSLSGNANITKQIENCNLENRCSDIIHESHNKQETYNNFLQNEEIGIYPKNNKLIKKKNTNSKAQDNKVFTDKTNEDPSNIEGKHIDEDSLDKIKCKKKPIYQKYYNKEHFRPYVGFIFQRESGINAKRYYKVIKSSEKSKIISKATVVEVDKNNNQISQSLVKIKLSTIKIKGVPRIVWHFENNDLIKECED